MATFMSIISQVLWGNGTIKRNPPIKSPPQTEKSPKEIMDKQLLDLRKTIDGIDADLNHNKKVHGAYIENGLKGAPLEAIKKKVKSLFIKKKRLEATVLQIEEKIDLLEKNEILMETHETSLMVKKVIEKSREKSSYHEIISTQEDLETYNGEMCDTMNDLEDLAGNMIEQNQSNLTENDEEELRLFLESDDGPPLPIPSANHRDALSELRMNVTSVDTTTTTITDEEIETRVNELTKPLLDTETPPPPLKRSIYYGLSRVTE